MKYVRTEHIVGDTRDCKRCTKCKTELPIALFGMDRSRRDGKMLHCKPCVAKKYALIEKSPEFKFARNRNLRRFRHTPKGIVTDIYQHQKRNSKARGHTLPKYTLKELQAWCLSQARFLRLFHEWEQSGFDTKKKPSIDRIDAKRGYTWDNINVLTWEENKFKQRWELGFLAGKTTFQILNGKVIGVFQSAAEAAKMVGGSQPNISRACLCPNRTVKGYQWSYSPLPS